MKISVLHAAIRAIFHFLCGQAIDECEIAEQERSKSNNKNCYCCCCVILLVSLVYAISRSLSVHCLCLLHWFSWLLVAYPTQQIVAIRRKKALLVQFNEPKYFVVHKRRKHFANGLRLPCILTRSTSRRPVFVFAQHFIGKCCCTQTHTPRRL